MPLVRLRVVAPTKDGIGLLIANLPILRGSQGQGGGAGFAVVADEVRNLAQRASAAACGTSLMMEGIVEKIRKGDELARNTATTFKAVNS